MSDAKEKSVYPQSSVQKGPGVLNKSMPVCNKSDTPRFVQRFAYICLKTSKAMPPAIRYDTPQDYCAAIGIRTLHPLATVVRYAAMKAYSNPPGLCCGYYVVSLYCGDTSCGVRYGRNMYDYRDRALFFTAPGQVVTFTGHKEPYRPRASCIALLLHPDYFRGTDLAQNIGRHRLFSYEAHEALRPSLAEAACIRSCLDHIAAELARRPDSHTTRVVCAAVGLLLAYCDRLYDRQGAATRGGTDVVSRFETLLNDYFAPAPGCPRKLPSVKLFADRLHLSPDYLSCLVKKETGRNMQEHILRKLIETAKDRLCLCDKSISQIAYELGFDYPQHFTRLFKAKTGVTPSQYRKDFAE